MHLKINSAITEMQPSLGWNTATPLFQKKQNTVFRRRKWKITAPTAVLREIMLAEYNYPCWELAKTLELTFSTPRKGAKGSLVITGAQDLKFALSSKGIGWHTWENSSSPVSRKPGISGISFLLLFSSSHPQYLCYTLWKVTDPCSYQSEFTQDNTVAKVIHERSCLLEINKTKSI